MSIDRVQCEKDKLKGLKEIRNFAAYLKGEIEYSHIPIPDICQEYICRSAGRIGGFLKELCKQFEREEGKSFDGVWEELLDKYPFNKEEKIRLKELGKCFGYCGIGLQLSVIERYLRELENDILHMEKKFHDNKKLILYFGVMSGLLLSIILL